MKYQVEENHVPGEVKEATRISILADDGHELYGITMPSLDGKIRIESGMVCRHNGSVLIENLVLLPNTFRSVMIEREVYLGNIVGEGHLEYTLTLPFDKFMKGIVYENGDAYDGDSLWDFVAYVLREGNLAKNSSSIMVIDLVLYKNYIEHSRHEPYPANVQEIVDRALKYASAAKILILTEE